MSPNSNRILNNNLINSNSNNQIVIRTVNRRISISRNISKRYRRWKRWKNSWNRMHKSCRIIRPLISKSWRTRSKRL